MKLVILAGGQGRLVPDLLHAFALLEPAAIKPLDAQALFARVAGCRALVSFEEYSVAGGLGAALLEALSAEHPLPVLLIGIGERFSSSCGSHAHALREPGLDLDSVRARVLPFASQLSAH